MSHTKEATMLVLDTGPSMNTPLHKSGTEDRNALKHTSTDKDQPTKLQIATNVMQTIMHQKMFYAPNDEIGMVAFGSKVTRNHLNDEHGEDQYAHIFTISHLDVPNVETCNSLSKVSELCGDDKNIKVDVLDGMIVALDLLHRRTLAMQFKRRIILLTDASSKIENTSDLEPVVEMMKSLHVAIEIVVFDFVHPQEKLEKKVKEDIGCVVKQEHPTYFKEANEKMLLSLVQAVGGQLVSVEEEIKLLKRGMKKRVMQVTKFRGDLEIGSFGIPVYCFIKVKMSTLPSLMKESELSQEKHEGVRQDRRYMDPDSPDEEVPPDQRIKAYTYGHESVPFSSADLEAFKFHTEKSLKLLGFVDAKSVHPANFMVNTNVFLSDPTKENAATCFATLVNAMRMKNQVAIARFVPRKNAAPKVIALIPHIPAKEIPYHAFWSQQLPFEEDLRDFEFPSILQDNSKSIPSKEQQQIANSLVDGLSVDDDEINPRTCYNPVLRRFYDSVVARAIDPDAGISPLPKCESMEARKTRVSMLILAFDDAFQLKEAMKKSVESKKQTFWSDVAEPEDVIDVHVKKEYPLKAEAFDEKIEKEQVHYVGSLNPIADFEALVDTVKSEPPQNDQNGQIARAIAGLKAQIEHILSHGQLSCTKALQCLQHFRKRSVDLGYSIHFNSFLQQLKAQYGATRVWDSIQAAGITLLSTDDDDSISITKQEAELFASSEI